MSNRREFTCAPLDDLVGGGLVLVPGPRGLSSFGGPDWLGRGHIGSEAIVSICLLGTEPFEPHEWIGEGGSACMRSVMITCARRGIAAVMVPFSERGWPKGVEPICMTLAYQAHCDTHGIWRWHGDPVTRRLRVIDQETWEQWLASVETPLPDGRERRQAFLSFIDNPTLAGPSFGVREVK
jgi:hypothetical protein